MDDSPSVSTESVSGNGPFMGHPLHPTHDQTSDPRVTLPWLFPLKGVSSILTLFDFEGKDEDLHGVGGPPVRFNWRGNEKKPETRGVRECRKLLSSDHNRRTSTSSDLPKRSCQNGLHKSQTSKFRSDLPRKSERPRPIYVRLDDGRRSIHWWMDVSTMNVIVKT